MNNWATALWTLLNLPQDLYWHVYSGGSDRVAIVGRQIKSWHFASRSFGCYCFRLNSSLSQTESPDATWGETDYCNTPPAPTIVLDITVAPIVAERGAISPPELSTGSLLVEAFAVDPIFCL